MPRNAIRLVGSSSGAPRLVPWSAEHVALERRIHTAMLEEVKAFVQRTLVPFCIVVSPDGQVRIVAIDEYIAELCACGADRELVQLLERCDASSAVLVVYTAFGVAATSLNLPPMGEAIARRNAEGGG